MHQVRRVLIVVRTYPTPAQKSLETSCTAAVTEAGEWLRLFPVPYRLLDQDKKFSKYQWIEVETHKSSDPRPESHKIRPHTIRIVSDVLSTDHAWKERRRFVDPLKAHCLCCLKEARDKYGVPTLGFIKPYRVEKLLIFPQEPTWTLAQQSILSQGDLFEEAPAKELEKIPFSFRYRFFCDHATCQGHTLSCTDWEMGEAWRKWKEKYGNDWEEKFRRKFEKEMLEEIDLHFFVGTLKAHPKEWIIVGLFYPPRYPALPLFDGLEVEK